MPPPDADGWYVRITLCAARMRKSLASLLVVLRVARHVQRCGLCGDRVTVKGDSGFKLWRRLAELALPIFP